LLAVPARVFAGVPLRRAAADRVYALSAPADMGDMGRADGHGGTEHLRAVWIGAAGVGAQRRVRHRAALDHGTWRASGVVDAHAGSGAGRGLVGVRRHAPPSAAPGRIRRRMSRARLLGWLGRAMLPPST